VEGQGCGVLEHVWYVSALTAACSRRSRPSRRLLAQAPRQARPLLKLVLARQARFENRLAAIGRGSRASLRNAIATDWRRITVTRLRRRKRRDLGRQWMFLAQFRPLLGSLSRSWYGSRPQARCVRRPRTYRSEPGHGRSGLGRWRRRRRIRWLRRCPALYDHVRVRYGTQALNEPDASSIAAAAS
jgi:hypothetical protein